MVKVVGEALEEVKRVNCKHCAAVLEYTLSDVKEVQSVDYRGVRYGHEYIYCPRGNHKVILRAW